MAELYNAQTRQPETLPEDQLNDAIMSGSHSYAAGTKVNVLDPSGEVGSLTAEQLPDALKQGYKIETPKEAAVREYLDENKGASGALKVFAGKTADELGMGIPGLIYDKTGDPLEVAKWEALKKQHDIAKVAGSVTGFGGSILVGGPIFKGAETAGKAAAEVVAKQLAAAGLKRGSQSVAKDIVARMATKAAELGTEGAVISSPRALTEAALGDPEQAGESLLIGAGIGAGLGLTGGALGSAFEKLNKSVAKRGESAARSEAAAIPEVVDGEAGTWVPKGKESDAGASVEPDSSFGVLKKEMLRKKENAPEIESALERQGITGHVGMLEDNHVIQDISSELSQKPTIAGVAFSKEVQATHDGLQDVASKILDRSPIDPVSKELTSAKVGAEARDAIINEVKERSKAFSDAYGEIEDKTKQIGVSEDSRLKIYQEFTSGKSVNAEYNTGIKNKVTEFTNEILKATNVDDLKRIRTAIGSEADKAFRAADTEAASVFKSLKDSVSELRVQSIDEHLQKMGVEGAESKAVADGLSNLISTTDKGYKDFKDFIKQLTGEASLGKVKNQSLLVEKLTQVPTEKLADKLFDPNNSRAMQFFKDKFPDAFEKLKQLHLQTIAEESTKDGTYQMGGLLGRLEKLSPEAQGVMFNPDQIQAIKDLRTIHDAIPGPFNPSRTAIGHALGKMFSIEGIAMNATDAIKYALLKGQAPTADGLLLAERAMKPIAEKLDQIPAAVSSLGRATETGKAPKSSGAMATMAGEKGDRRAAFAKVSEAINKVASNPGALSENVSKLASGVSSEGAPNIANAFNTSMVRAVMYLNSQLPRANTPPSPFSNTPYRPSDMELSEFERKLHAVMDPLSIIDDLKRGTLTRGQVEAVQATHPKIYDQIRKRIVNSLSEGDKKIPYKARIRISTLMGVPLEPSLQPQSIQMLQMAHVAPDPQAQQKKIELDMAGRAMSGNQHSNGST